MTNRLRRCGRRSRPAPRSAPGTATCVIQGRPSYLSCEIEMGRRSVVDARLGAEIVADADQQMRLARAIRLIYLIGAARVPGSGDDHTRHAVPLPNRSTVVTDATLSTGGNAPSTIASPNPLPAWLNQSRVVRPPEIDDVGGAGAVDVRQPDAPRVELVGPVEARRAVHRHLGAEPAIAEIGPVADLAVAHAHDVGQPVAATCRRDRSSACLREHHARAALLVQRLGDAVAGPKPSSASDGVPDAARRLRRSARRQCRRR